MIWVLCAAAAVILLFSLYTYRICFHVSKKREVSIPDTPADQQLRSAEKLIKTGSGIMDRTEYERVSVKAHDGKLLRGRYYHVRDNAPLLLAFHGYRSAATRDCAGAFALALKFNFNILAVDQRAHGESEGRVITFGIRERLDCLCWAQYAAERFGRDCPIVLCGISMGAATVLMASSLPLPANVVCIAADCPYSSPAAILRKVSRDVGYPPALVYPFIWLGGWIYGGFRVTEADAVTAVRQAKVPILLIHGEDDGFVPCEMSREILKNCGSRAELHTFPGADHGLSYLTDPARYERIWADFFRSVPALRGHMAREM